MRTTTTWLLPDSVIVQNRKRPDRTCTWILIVSFPITMSSSVKSQESVATDSDRVPIEIAPRTKELRVSALAPQYIVIWRTYTGSKETVIIE